MIVESPKIIINSSKITYSADIKFLEETHTIVFSVEDKFKDMVTTSSDPLLIALLIPCMATGEDLVIKGKVSKKLLYHIQTQIQLILIEIIPHLKKISIVAENVIDETLDTCDTIMSGFSAGVDAYVTLEDYFLNPKYDLKITHFLFNNLTFKEEKKNKKLERILKLSEYYNFPLIETSTNLHFFYVMNKKIKGINFEQTHTLRNVAVAHFLSSNNCKFLYSSTYHYNNIAIIPSTDLSIADLILLPLLSSEKIECISVGSEYTRIEKTLKAIENPTASKYLDLCIGKEDTFINCGVCRKCKRALALLESLGKKDKVKNIFNLPEWDKIKESYLKNLHTHTQINDRELYNFFKDKNIFQQYLN